MPAASREVSMRLGQMINWVEDRRTAIYRSPNMWGSLESIEAQLLLLLEVRLVALGIQLPEEGVERQWFHFVSTVKKYPIGVFPLSHYLLSQNCALALATTVLLDVFDAFWNTHTTFKNPEMTANVRHKERAQEPRMLQITKGSHRDHGLTEEQLQFLLAKFADRKEFFIETVELPEELGMVPVTLYGPLMGDPPVDDIQCVFRVRGKRKGTSKMIKRPTRYTRTVTIIAGPPANPRAPQEMVLYTAFGGPAAPKEPWDCPPNSAEHHASISFWATHALAVG